MCPARKLHKGRSFSLVRQGGLRSRLYHALHGIRLALFVKTHQVLDRVANDPDAALLAAAVAARCTVFPPISGSDRDGLQTGFQSRCRTWMVGQPDSDTGQIDPVVVAGFRACPVRFPPQDPPREFLGDRHVHGLEFLRSALVASFGVRGGRHLHLHRHQHIDHHIDPWFFGTSGFWWGSCCCAPEALQLVNCSPNRSLPKGNDCLHSCSVVIFGIVIPYQIQNNERGKRNWIAITVTVAVTVAVTGTK
mmetsp:Transcript_11735/g.27483  ORF Transcript_11735/g.27483 Transcript_11735/m.27483 type:complete len:249 (+) Transcript_11735:761-1507(+)